MICYRQLTDKFARTQYFDYLKKELFRKSIHICAAFTPFFFFHFFSFTFLALLFALVVYCVCETLRVKGINVPFISSITALAARKRDENKFVLGPVTLCIGVMASALLFCNISPQSMTIGIFALSFGDGLASLAGKTFGKVDIPFVPGKTAEGSLACFLAMFLSCFAVCQNVKFSLLAACLGMAVEMLPLKDFDNLVIPILLSSVAFYFNV